MRLLAANPGAAPFSRGTAEGRVHYLRGSDPTQWVTNVASYAEAGFHDIYPGIDILYSVTDWHFEYNLVLAPGADPGAIRRAFESAGSVRVQPGGHLAVATSMGTVVHRRPAAWQLIDGVKTGVAARFVRRGRNQIGFALGRYDRSRTVTIDPVISMAYIAPVRSMSGTGPAMAVDAAGNVYLTGVTNLRDFPGNPVTAGASCGFVMKLKSDLSALVYSSYFGCDGTEGRAIAVDTSGAAYVTGSTISSQSPLVNAIQGLRPGGGDAFVLRLSPDGSRPVYSTPVGGVFQDQGTGIAVDASGNAYVTGSTVSPDFPMVGAIQSRIGSQGEGCGVLGCQKQPPDAFVFKVNAAGSALLYSTYLGGNGDDAGNGIAVDSAGNAYVAGYTNSTTFPTTPDAYRTSCFWMAPNPLSCPLDKKWLPVHRQVTAKGNGSIDGKPVFVPLAV